MIEQHRFAYTTQPDEKSVLAVPAAYPSAESGSELSDQGVATDQFRRRIACARIVRIDLWVHFYLSAVFACCVVSLLCLPTSAAGFVSSICCVRLLLQATA